MSLSPPFRSQNFPGVSAPAFCLTGYEEPSPFRLDPMSEALETYVRGQGGSDQEIGKIEQMLKRRLQDDQKVDGFIKLAGSLSLSEMVAWLSHGDRSEMEQNDRQVFRKLKHLCPEMQCTFQDVKQLLYPMEDKAICRIFGRLIRGADCTYSELIDLLYPDACGGWQGMQKISDLFGRDLDFFLPVGRHFYLENKMQMIFESIRAKVGDRNVQDRDAYPFVIADLMIDSGDAELAAELMNAMQMTEKERIPIIKWLIEKHFQHAVHQIPRFGILSQEALIDLAYFSLGICVRVTAEGFLCFGINSSAERATLAKLCAQKNAHFTIRSIDNFQLDSPYDQVEVLKTCIQSVPNEVPKHLSKCAIKDQPALLELAHCWIEASSPLTGTLLANLPLFGIQDPDDFVALLKRCVKKDGIVNIEDLEEPPEKVVQNVLGRCVWGSHFANSQSTLRIALDFMKNMAESQGFKIDASKNFTPLLLVGIKKDPKLTHTYLERVGLADKAQILMLSEMCRKQDRSIPSRANQVLKFMG